jgi:hypothetical protein
MPNMPKSGKGAMNQMPMMPEGSFSQGMIGNGNGANTEMMMELLKQGGGQMPQPMADPRLEALMRMMQNQQRM